MTDIHPTALVSPRAELAADVQVGPYTVITENVRIGEGTVINHHVTITGQTTIGKANLISSYAAIGFPPQDLTYKNDPTRLVIGDHNIIREFTTLNIGTVKGGGITTIGNHNFLMAYSHIAHDCVLEDYIIMANGVQLGGHCKVENYASLGGLAGAHHFVTIGQHSFVGGLAKVIRDVPPYMIAEGHPARVRTVNTIGLERRNFPPKTIKALKDAYKLIWRSNYTIAQSFKLLEKRYPELPEINALIQSFRQMSKGKQGRAREALRNSHF